MESSETKLIEADGFVIKRVDERDMDAILAVYRQCEDFLALGPVPFASPQMVSDDLRLSQEHGGIFCGIFINDAMIGVLDFFPCGHNENPKNAFIALLMLSQSCRGKGIGARVVSAVECDMSRRGVRSIGAGVMVNNAPAIAFWDKMGYRIVSGPELLPDQTTVFRIKKDIL